MMSRSGRDESSSICRRMVKGHPIIIYVSPFKPEPGSEYHEYFVRTLRKHGVPVIVLAGIPRSEDYKKKYGSIEKYGNIIVFRSFWAPRIQSMKTFFSSIKYAVLSLRSLIRVIGIAKKLSSSVIVIFNYGATREPGIILGEHHPLGMLLARLAGAKVVWIIHNFLTTTQLKREVREHGLPRLISLFVILYYIFINKLAAISSHKIVVLVNGPNAYITEYFKEILKEKRKVIEEVHPVFMDNNININNSANSILSNIYNKKSYILIGCIGYIRRGKGYHVLLDWLRKLKNKNYDLYLKLRVLIAGFVADKRDIANLQYIIELIKMKKRYKLNNVIFLLNNLTDEEFKKLISISDVIWCAYEKDYGPSGILAWAKGYKKRVIINNSSIWAGEEPTKINTFSEHVSRILESLD